MSEPIEDEDFIKIVYYGHQGSGKTTAMASLAKLGKIIYVDAESGLKRTPLTRLGIPWDNIERRSPRTYEDHEKLYWEVKERLEKGEPILGVVMDSMTEIQVQLVAQAQNKRIDYNYNLGRTGEAIDRDFVDRDDYNKWTVQGRRLIRWWRDLSCHVAFGALDTKDDSTGEVTYLPEMSPKLRKSLLGYVGIVCASYTTESPYVANPEHIEYLGVMRKIKMYEGKDRLGVTPPILSNPGLDRIVQLLHNELDLSTDPDQRAYLKRIESKGKKE